MKRQRIRFAPMAGFLGLLGVAVWGMVHAGGWALQRFGTARHRMAAR